MFASCSNTKRWSKGFTLIELLVVIAIISLLSSIVFASLKNARQKAMDARATAEFYQIQTAAEMDYGDNNNYAPDVGPGGNPRFVGTYLKTYGASYYCSTCVYDWQNWGSQCILIDLYQTTAGPALRRHCIYTPGCACSDI